MKKKNIAMAAILLLTLMAIPLWGLFAQPGGVVPGGSDDVVIYTFMLDGGHVHGSFDDVIITRRGGESFTLPMPERYGSVFAGWTQIGSVVHDEFMDYNATGSFVSKLYIALWSEGYVPAFGPSYTPAYVPFVPTGGYIPIMPLSANITFQLAGGVWDGVLGNSGNQFTTTDAFDMVSAPGIPVWPMPYTMNFDGWLSGGALGVPVDLSIDTFTTDTILFADWTAFIGPEPTVTFNLGLGHTFYAGGGMGSGISSVQVIPEGITPDGIGGNLLSSQLPDDSLFWHPNGDTFGGWSADPLLANPILGGGSIIVNAIWLPFSPQGPFDVTFNLMGGQDATGIPLPLVTVVPQIPSGGTIPASQVPDVLSAPSVSGIFPPAGFTSFSHWATGPALNAPVGDPSLPINDDINFYAVWSPALGNATFDVTFDLGGGLFAGLPFAPATTVPTFSNQDLSTLVPSPVTRDGFAFSHWVMHMGGASTSVTPGALTFVTGDVVLEAEWNPIHRASFDFNLGTHVNPAINAAGYLEINADAITGILPAFEIAALEAALSRTGFALYGWKVLGAAPDAPIVDLTLPITANVYLVAVWRAQVTFNFGAVAGISMSTLHPDQLRNIRYNLSVPFADVPDYLPAGSHVRETHIGWHQMGVTPPALMSRVDVSNAAITDPTTFIAQWSNTYFQVRFEAPPSILLAPGNYSEQYDPNTVVLFVPSGTAIATNHLPVFTLPSNTTYRWELTVGTPNQIDPAGNGALGQVVTQTTITFELVLYIPVIFDLNGGYDTATNLQSPVERLVPLANAGVATVTAPVVNHSVPGISFQGWRRVDALGNVISPVVPPNYYLPAVVNSMPITQEHWRFEAVWDIDAGLEFTARFNLSGGNYPPHIANPLGPIYRSNLPVNQLINPSDIPTPPVLDRPGFNFVQWVIGANNTPVSPAAISPAALLANDMLLTFTAVWDPQVVPGHHFATFDFAGGTYAPFGSLPSAVIGPIANGDAVNVADVPEPTRPGHLFLGWVVTGAVPMQHVNPHQVTSDADISFTARWIPVGGVVYDVTFNLAGGTCPTFGTGSVNSGPFLGGTTIPSTEVPAPGRVGFTFVEWRQEPSGATFTQATILDVIINDYLTFTAVWAPVVTPGNFFATFNLASGNYGEYGLGPVIVGPFVNDTQIPSSYVPTPVRAGHNFVHWVISGTSDVVTPSDLATAPDSNVSFTAVWVPYSGPGQFIAVFNLGGGVSTNFGTGIGGVVTRGPFGVNTQIPAVDVPNMITPRADGAIFQGWRVEGGGNAFVTPSALAAPPNADITFNAIWLLVSGANDFVATFNLAGGTVAGHGTADYQIGPFPNNTQIPAALVPLPTRLGFTFSHWTMEDDLTDTLVIPSALTPAPDDDVYFRAVWEPEIPPTPFDVTFVLNGGNITGNTANVVVGPFDAGDFILAAQVPAPVRTDFTFLGWAIAGTTTPLVDPTANSLDGAITFVAQWEPDDIAGHFFATFVLNGGVYPGYDLQVIRGPFANGTQIPGIEVPSPTRLGYTYHWIITGTADDAVVDPSDLSTAPDANISFTAIWTAVDTPGHFIATFVLAGGNVGGNLGPITVGGIPNDTQIPVASVPVPVRLNYTFEHWVITSTNTPVTPSALNPAPNANISFTAVWEPDGNVVTQHTVTFVFTGGTSATHLPAAGPFMVDINENSPITAANVPTVTRGADIFEGWQQVGGAPGVLLTNAQVANINVSAPMTFNAVWLTLTDDTFEATFDLNGGDVSGNTANVVVGPFPVGTQIPTQDVPAPDRANFTFVGWRLNGVLVDPSALSPAPTADVTFVAAWVMDDIPGYYSATFDLYFGTCPTFGIGPVVQGPFAHGTQVPPQYVPAPVRANFTFEHWVITGTSTQVDPTDLTPAPTGNVSFTAVWEPVVLPGHFIATFNLAGGTFNNSQGPIIVPGLVNDQQIPAGSVPNPIRTNYTFQHWVVTSTNTPVTPSALNPAPNADISFTAVWEPDGIVVTQHAVTFVFNNGTSTTHSPAGGPFTVDINDGAQITLPNIPVVTRSGQHFLGWQQQGAAPNVMSRNQVANIAVSAPMTFEAVWSSIGDEVFEATFILAGGTYAGSTANVVVGPFLSGTQIPASEVPDPLRTGFTFEHWVITGTTTPVDPSSLTPAPTADISFTAVWDFVTPPGYYRVTFRPGALAGATLTAGNIGDMLSGDVVFNIPVGSAIVAANIPTVNLPTAQNFWLYEWALTTGNLQPLTLSEVAGRIPDGDVVFTAEYFVEITIGNNDPIRVPMGDINDTTVGDILDGIDTTNPDDPDDEFKGWIRVDRDGNNITTAERGFYTREELDEMGLDPSEYWNFDPVWRSGTFNATFIFAGGTLASHTGDSVVRGPILIGQLIPSAYVPVLTRTGYTFRRWVVTGTTNEANLSTLRPTADVSFTAEWDNGDTGRYYTLTFNPNGGIMLFGYNTVRTVAYGTVITELPGAEWAGHRFEGWLIGTTTQEQTVPFTMTGDLTLVADWTELPERNYTLTLNPNGGTLPEGIEAVQTHAYGTILPSLPTPTRAGYTFVGWFEGTAANAQSLPIVITRDLTLTARWTGGTTERNYTLTLNPNGGALPSGVEAVQTHAYGTVITSLPTPTRAGHTFTGWLVGTTTQGQAVPFTITGNVTLTAGWVPVTGRNYTLTFNPNGGALPTGVEAVQTHAYGTVITSLPTPTRAGHTFTGWFIGATTQGQAVPFTITGNLTLTAGWTPDVGTPPPGQNATITLVLNGGTVSGGVTTFTHPVGTRVYSHNIPTPTRAGYNFVGWLYNHQWATFPFTLNHNVVLSAVWAPVAPTTLTVTFNPGTGTLPSGIPAERHGPFGFRVDNFPTPIAPTGYTFVGWYLDGIRVTGAIYATRNMTLFAHYQRTTVGQNHTITFVPNGGTMPANTALTQTHAYGTHINTLPIPTRAGHTFVGWMSGNAIQPIPFIVRGNMTLTAAWVTTPQTPSPTPQPTVPPTHLIVAFDPGPGSFPAGEGGIRTGVYGFVVNTMPNPTRPGHVFAGWSIGTTPITLPFTVRQDTTITARWTPVGTLVNPQTSPIQVTFTIFGAVLLVGIAAFGIMKLTGKQLAAMGQYRTSMTRFNREKRITDMFEKREPKDKK